MIVTRRVPVEYYNKLEEIVLTIKNPIEHVETAKARRARYFNTKKDKIPLKYLNKKLYVIKGNKIFNKETKKEVIKNNKSVGKPNYWKINGNDLYSATLHPMLRKTIAVKVHDYLYEYVKELPQLSSKLTKGVYLSVKFVIFDTMPEDHFWDCDNKWPWTKWFNDTLTEHKKWSDDDIRYVRFAGGTEYVEVDDKKKKKFEFVITKIKLNNNLKKSFNERSSD